jgi:methionine biosynthesis protein MetW
MNDNRNYDYTDWQFHTRAEFHTIADWITPGTKVIDLACGNGSLMKLLKEQKGVECEGLDLAPTGVDFCRRHGLNARVAAIDQAASYAGYSDGQFDYAVCNVTVQMVTYPEVLLAQMQRIARRQIVSFPNFAYLPNRLDLLLHGRMPKPMIFGYDWYSTGHIHHLSVTDFRGFCRTHGMKIIREHHTGPALGRGRWPVIAQAWPNLFSIVAIFEGEGLAPAPPGPAI